MLTVLATIGITLAALGLSVVAGAWLVPLVLRHAEKSPAVQSQAVLRAGTWIGLLERLAVTGTILVGHPEGVAIVVAIKALGRFEDLREHRIAGERFVVGTLASVIWSCAVGLGARALIVAL